MKMNKIFPNKYFRYGSLIIGGIFLGWLFFHSSRKVEPQGQSVQSDQCHHMDLRYASPDTYAQTGEMPHLRNGIDPAEPAWC